MSGRARAAITLALCAGIGLALGACASGSGQTTYYSAADMQEAADAVRQQLASSDWLAERDETAPRIVLQPTNLRNRSSERITSTDRWAAVTRLLYEPSLQRLLRERNVAVLLPESAPLEAERFASEEAPAGKALEPTHALNAVFQSVRRAGSKGEGPADTRKDVFRVEYTIVNLETRETVWEGESLFARTAHGLLVD